MENNIPNYILRELEMIGLMPRHLPDDVPDEPVISYKYRMPIFDENGEPDF